MAVTCDVADVRCSFLVNIWLNWKPMDAVPCPDSLRRRLTRHKLRPLPVTKLSQETEIRPAEFQPIYPREDGKKVLGDEHQYEGDTSWDFTMGKRKARLNMQIDWRYMKYHVEEESASKKGTSDSSVYIRQDTGLQASNEQQHNSAGDIIQVYTEEPSE